MALCENRRFRKGVTALAIAALLSLAGQTGLGKAAAADSNFVDSSNRNPQAGRVGPNAMGLSLAAAGRRLPFSSDRSLQGATPAFYAAAASTFTDAAILGSRFPEIFGSAMPNEAGARQTATASLRTQIVNLPGAGALIPPVEPLHRVAARQRSALHDTLLFALIFKDGQDAWSARQMASMIAGDDRAPFAEDTRATCERKNLCGFSTAPVPGALWLFTALLIGFFGVGYRRQRPQS